MAFKIFKKTNYFYIVDSVTNVVNEGLAKDVKVKREKTDSTSFSFENVNGIQQTQRIAFADIVDENGDAYTDLATFVAWYEENTGFNLAGATALITSFNSYSTTELEIGTYLGLPLYKKTLVLGALASGANSLLYDVDGGIRNLVKSYGEVELASGKVYEIPKNSLDNTTSGIYFDELKDDTKIDGYVGTDFEEASAIVGGYYHIYYTKKSDVVFNFDITADWENIADYPVTDRVSFELFLSEREYNTINDLTNIVCTDFNLENGRLRCVLNANGTILELSGIGITDFVGIGNVLGLETLSCSENNIVFFNPTIKLQTTIQTLGLNINNMTENGYVLSEQWANSLSVSTGKVIDLSSNVDSVLGTDFESILISKGWTVIT